MIRAIHYAVFETHHTCLDVGGDFFCFLEVPEQHTAVDAARGDAPVGKDVQTTAEETQQFRHTRVHNNNPKTGAYVIEF